MKLLSYASVGHVGIYRDKFIKNTVEYYFRVPSDIESRKVILLDPLLATGDTASATIERLKQYGVKDIRFVKKAGFKSAITTKKQINKYSDDKLFTIPRLSTHGKMDMLQFYIMISRGRYRF